MKVKTDFGAIVDLVGYGGYVFDEDIFVMEHEVARGWYVWGRNGEKYGRREDGKGAYISRIAWVDAPDRKYPGRNGLTSRGWRTKREALAIADKIRENRKELVMACKLSDK